MDNAKTLEPLITRQVEIIEKERDAAKKEKEIETLLSMIEKSNDFLKIDANLCETEAKYETELKIQEQKEKADRELQERQIKEERIGKFLDVGKGLVAISVFALFEILAHKRDMADVIERDAMHVKKNSFKLKLW